MGIFDFLFGGKSSTNNVTPTSFNECVKLSIDIIGSKGKWYDTYGVIKLLSKNGIPKSDAIEIAIFMPMAFCRKMLPEVTWPETYIEYYSEDKQIEKPFKDNEKFLIIQEETNTYWDTNPNQNAIMQILFLSADFNAINKLLHDGGSLEDAVVSPPMINRG